MSEPIDNEEAITQPRLGLITELLLQLREELLKRGYTQAFVNRRVLELLDCCIDDLYEQTKE